jgi:DNA-binding response OmpR family regulator
MTMKEVVLTKDRKSSAQGGADEVDVLVVETDPDLRGHITDVLKSDGYRVAEAEDGFGAIEQLRSRRVGAMVLDPAASASGGFDLLEKLEEIGAPPVVMLWSDQDTRTEESRPSLVMAELKRPIEPWTLTALVATALESDLWQGLIPRRPPAGHDPFDRITD